MLITPFDANGDPDGGSLARLVEHAVRSGSGSLAIGGLASESHALSYDERCSVAEHVLHHVAGRVSVVVGVSAESTQVALKLARHAQENGAAAIMLAPPAVTQVSAPALARHYEQVADAVDVPMMIQDASLYAGAPLGTQLLRQLVQRYPHIRYVKTESVPSSSVIEDLRIELGEVVSIFSGGGGLHLMDALRAGAVGTIPGCDIPAVLVAVYRAFSDGRSVEAEQLFRRALPLLVYEMQSLDFCIACQKSLLVHQRVIDRAGLRPPGRVLTATQEAQLIATYQSIQPEL